METAIEILKRDLKRLEERLDCEKGYLASHLARTGNYSYSIATLEIAIEGVNEGIRVLQASRAS